MKSNIKYRVLGVMSGTSLDGIDLAICNFTKKKLWKFKIEKATTISYSKYWKKILQDLHLKDNKTIKKIDVKYGAFLAKNINSFLDDDKVDFISSHGHTIFHQPEKNFTLQIGDGQEIARLTRNITINNFRKKDVSLNGQGAPLVPVGDKYLFSENKYCLNLGGFANISIKKNNKITAFDICPVNIVLNQLSKNLNIDYDDKGKVARKGKLIPTLLKKLNKLSYYSKKGPKSLAKEWVEKNINHLLSVKYDTADLLHTFCEHIAIQIGAILKDGEALTTGGGCYNIYLVERIKYYCLSKIKLPDNNIINFKEAVIFAFLGVLKFRNEVNCLRSVTGAKRDNCGGIIHDI